VRRAGVSWGSASGGGSGGPHGCGPSELEARLRRPSGGTRVRERWTDDPTRKAPCRWRGAQPKRPRRKPRRRDGGGNRRGSRRALGRRLPENRHRLWGLSDADQRCRLGEREPGRVEQSMTRRTPEEVQRDGVRARQTSTTAMTPHRCAPRHSPDETRRSADPPTHWTLAQAPVSVKRACRKRTLYVTTTSAARPARVRRPPGGRCAATDCSWARGARGAGRSRA
jgi:hypothetical protein